MMQFYELKKKASHFASLKRNKCYDHLDKHVK